MSQGETKIGKGQLSSEVGAPSGPWALHALTGEATRSVVQVEASYEQAVLENGGRLATAETYAYYQRYRVAPLWVAIALLCFADPRHWSVGQMRKVEVCRDRLRMAIREKRRGGLMRTRPEADVSYELAHVGLEWVRRWAIKALLPVPMLFPVNSGARPSAREAPKVVKVAEVVSPATIVAKRERARRSNAEVSLFLREAELLQMLPFSRATLWRRVKAERFPRPVQPSPGVTAWVRSDIDKWLEEQSSSAALPVRVKRAQGKS
jgi:prophage regulatory protein